MLLLLFLDLVLLETKGTFLILFFYKNIAQNAYFTQCFLIFSIYISLFLLFSSIFYVLLIAKYQTFHF